MNLPEFNERGERLVLDHEPVPPYRAVFWVAFLGALGYLGWILVAALGSASGGH